jgi:probable HAF family extracellular repeat protein
MPARTAYYPRRVRLTDCCVLAALLLASAFAGAQDYSLTKLPAGTEPVAVNSSGQVTGTTLQTGHDQSFFWTRTGGLQLLGDLGGGTTQARAMNDSGAIVGSSSLATPRIHAFLWTQAGGIQDLGSPQGGDSIAIAINASGEVIGYSYPSSGTSDPHAFYWSQATGSLDLGVTDFNTESFPLAINNTGEVTGFQYGNGLGFSAFRWTLATGMQVLDSFYVPFTSPYQNQLLGDDGKIAGSDSVDHAALRLPDDTVQDLGTLPPDTSSVSLYHNSAGHVVGTSRPKHCCGAERTFFWTDAGMVDIGSLPKHGNTRNVPYGFNNRDQIVGLNGATYLWSPTIGMHQISGISFKFAPLLSHALNDAGQMLGFGAGFGNAVLASPTMHVSVNSSQNPSQVGESVTFTASVSAIVGLPPDGELVTFKDGSKVLGTATLSNGSASITTATLKAKTHAISATYAGDDNYLPSKPGKLSQVVNP